jgi:ferrochelatase
MGPIDAPDPLQALLVVSFGGPEGTDEVMPFLLQVTAGRGVPDQRLEAVAQNYHARGGVSPLNGLIREFLAELRERLDLPIYWGNRNSDPFLEDTIAQMTSDGVSRALAFVTSAFASPSGCRQYLDDLERARAAVGPDAPTIEKLRLFHNHPGFLDPFADSALAAFSTLTDKGCRKPRLVFTAHSLPIEMAQSAPYVTQLEAAAQIVAPPGVPWDLVYQSRSGPPGAPWLEPDIASHLAQLAGDGVDGVAVVPLGFVMDHMEVVHDLDTEAAATASQLGLEFVRATTPWSDPRFADMVAALVHERISGVAPRALGGLPVWPDICPPGCCVVRS